MSLRIKKKYFLLILLSWFWFGLNSQTFRKEAGKIKSISSKYYTLTNDTTKADSSCLFKIEIEHYNSKGILTIDSSKFFKGYSVGFAMNEYEYDNKKNLIEKTWKSSNGHIQQTDSFYYSTKNNLLKHHMWFASGETRGSLYSYDKNNNLSKQEFFNKQGEITWYVLSFFDSENREIRNESWHMTKGFEDSTIYNYDENSNLIYELNVDKNGEIVWETYISYNSENLIIGEIYSENSIFFDSVQYSYNKQLDIIYEKASYPNNIYVYNSNYVYDKMGNWVEKITFEEGQIIEIINRRIIYY